MRTHRLWAIALVGLSLLFGMGTQARAAEIDPYLPEDTESVVIFNFRSLFESKLIKNQIGLDTIRAAIMGEESVAGPIKALGIDPLKDVDRLVTGSPAKAEDDQGIVIIRGRFDVAKLNEAAVKFAKDNESFEAMKVKDLKGKEHQIFKTSISANPAIGGGNVTLWIGVASNKAILAAMSKDYLLDALQTKPGATGKLKNKTFSRALTKLDDKQTLTFASVGSVVVEGLEQANAQIPLPESVLKAARELDAVMGGVKVDDGVELSLSMAAKTAKAANDINIQLTQGLALGKLLVAQLGGQQPQLKPVMNLVNSLRNRVSENVVTITGGISAEDLGIPRDQ